MDARDSATLTLPAASVLVALLQGSTAAAQPEVATTGDDARMHVRAEAEGPAGAPFEPGALPALVALVPGAAVHGAGHFVGGDRETAGELLIAEGVAVGMMAVGGGILYLTGGAEEGIAPLFVLVGSGLGLFVTSWLADVYGSATGGEGAGRPTEAPFLETSLGYRYVHDPQFDYGSFAVLSATVRPGRFRVTPSAWIALGERNERARLEGAVRLLSGGESWRGRGTWVDVEVAGTWHDYHDDGFAYVMIEGSLRGRYDLADLSPTLRGAFGELAFGYGLQAFDYDAPGLTIGADTISLLLLRWGFGLYLGEQEGRHGELLVFYDHRRDGFVGGLGWPAIYNSVPGHAGVEGHAYFVEDWALEVELLAGSAIVAGAGVRHRWGGGP